MDKPDHEATYGLLVVEDDAGDEMMTLRALKASGLPLKVTVARDGAEALQILSGDLTPYRLDQPPRLILLDLKLPKQDGYEILKAARANPATASIPIVGLTSSSDRVSTSQALSLGLNSCVRKPVDYNDYISTVIRTVVYWLELNFWPA